ncbi:MAG: methylenetetrahydrofolate reductase [Gammaproteobacteria bacterium]|nr:methylenetetrahydrofolate reductase [Gammaproteobacteria bacterium]
MTRLRDALASSHFVVTTELNPPKGTDLSTLFDTAKQLHGSITAVNLTDSHAAKMSMSPLAVAHLLNDFGIEPILQVTGRDRNRIALQGDLLGAQALGIRNVLCMGGDPPGGGDHPDAKPVFDLGTTELLSAAAGLNRGIDSAGHSLNAPTSLFIGAVVNPGADDLDAEVARMREKVDAGATFFQTQAVYEAHAFEQFANRIHDLQAHVIAGIIPLKSLKMAKYLHDKVPGITIPDALFKALERSDNVTETSIDAAATTVRDLQPLCAGVHLMTIGWEAQIPHILARAGMNGSA